MAALFALGVMSLEWMAVTAALITAEKVIPWRRSVRGFTFAILAGTGNDGGGSSAGAARPGRACSGSSSTDGMTNE